MGKRCSADEAVPLILNQKGWKSGEFGEGPRVREEGLETGKMHRGLDSAGISGKSSVT